MPSPKKTNKSGKPSKAAKRKASASKKRTPRALLDWESYILGDADNTTRPLDDLVDNLDQILENVPKSDHNHRPTRALYTGVEALQDELEDPSSTVHNGIMTEIIGQIAHVETSIYLYGNFQPTPPYPAGNDEYTNAMAEWFQGIDAITTSINSSFGEHGPPANPSGTDNDNIKAYYVHIFDSVANIAKGITRHRRSKGPTIPLPK
jgi:hypothetical protein